MNRRVRAHLAGALLALPLFTGCAATYMPRPSPRVQMVTENGSLVLVKDGRSHPFNMFGGNLEDVVQGNPQAEAEAQSFRSKTVTGFVLSTLGAVGAGIGTGILVGNELQSEPSTTLRAASLTSAIGGLVLSIVGSAIGGSAQPHLWNAINVYNDGLPVAYPAWPAQPAYPGYPGAPGYSAMPLPVPPLPSPVVAPPAAPVPPAPPPPR